MSGRETGTLAEAARDADRALARDPNGGAVRGAPLLEPLLDGHDLEAFRSRWQELQAGFVDEPRRSVTDADRLVTEVVDQLEQSFAAARGRLEAQWSGGRDVSTEDLRVALRRYRSFFDRLLST